MELLIRVSSYFSVHILHVIPVGSHEMKVSKCTQEFQYLITIRTPYGLLDYSCKQTGYSPSLSINCNNPPLSSLSFACSFYDRHTMPVYFSFRYLLLFSWWSSAPYANNWKLLSTNIFLDTLEYFRFFPSFPQFSATGILLRLLCLPDLLERNVYKRFVFRTKCYTM